MSKAKQCDFLLAGYTHPTTGEALSGGKVYTYINGTSTLINLYTDRDQGGTATNPIVLDSSGRAEVYGAGIYKFVIYDSSDVLIETINGLEYQIDSVQVVTDLAESISEAGSDPTTLIINDEQTLSANLTVPTNIVLQFTRSGSINRSTYTLTINGEIDAGEWEILTGSGTLTLGDLAQNTVNPFHFGLVLDDISEAANNVIAINTTLEKAVVCRLPAGKIYINDSILIETSYNQLLGSGRSNTILFASTTISDPMVRIGKSGGIGFVTLADFAIDGDDKADYGIKYGHVASAQVTSYNLYVRECNIANMWLFQAVGCNWYDPWIEFSNDHGIAHYWADGTEVNNNNFFGGRVLYNSDCAIYLSGKTTNMNFYGTWFENNQNQALLMDCASLAAAGQMKAIKMDGCYFEAQNQAATAGGSHIKAYLNGGTYYPQDVTITQCNFSAIGSSVDSYLIEMLCKGLTLDSNSYDFDVMTAVKFDGADSYGLNINDYYAQNDTANEFTGDGMGNMDFRGTPDIYKGVKVHRAATSNQTIPATTATVMSFDGEDYDPLGDFTSTTVTGTTDGTTASRLVDSGAAFTSALVGYYAWNSTDDTYTTVTSFISSTELGLDDDIFVSGETYEIYLSRFTPTLPGTYQIDCQLTTGTITDNGEMQMRILKNGVLDSISYDFFSGTQGQSKRIANDIPMDAGDYLEIALYTSHATDIRNKPTWCYLIIKRV